MANKPALHPRKRTSEVLYESARLTSLTAVGSSKSGSRRAARSSIDLFDTAFLAERGLLTQPESAGHGNAPLPHHPAPHAH